MSIARKLRSAEDPMAVQSLLSVLAFVACSDASQLVQLLSCSDGGDTDTSSSPSSSSSALDVAMVKWTERHMEIRTPYDIKLSISALGALLACPHPALDAVVVRGKRMDTGSGIRTRAKSSQQHEQWSHVPLRVKLITLLADSFIEASMQGRESGDGGGGGGGGGEEGDDNDFLEEDEYEFDDDDDDDDEYDDDDDEYAGRWDGTLNI